MIYSFLESLCLRLLPIRVSWQSEQFLQKIALRFPSKKFLYYFTCLIGLVVRALSCGWVNVFPQSWVRGRRLPGQSWYHNKGNVWDFFIFAKVASIVMKFLWAIVWDMEIPKSYRSYKYNKIFFLKLALRLCRFCTKSTVPVRFNI